MTPMLKRSMSRFHDSGLYACRGVSPRVYEEFLAADSKGTFLNEVIKPRYSYRKA